MADGHRGRLGLAAVQTAATTVVGLAPIPVRPMVDGTVRGKTWFHQTAPVVCVEVSIIPSTSSSQFNYDNIPIML